VYRLLADDDGAEIDNTVCVCVGACVFVCGCYYMCPHTTICVLILLSVSAYYICVLILRYVSSYYMRVSSMKTHI
jgi:hypothetical protein